MTDLAIRVRESAIDLPSDLAVDVPQHPLKVDRGTVVFSWRPRANDRLMLKVYGQMGIFNWLRKQVVGYRARREFRTLARLRDVGIPCCEPMFWGTGRSRVHGLFEVVATREIPGVVTFAARSRSLDAEARTAIVGRLLEALARMHRAGVFHGAFFLTNVLVETAPGAAVPWIVDLEKSVCFASDIRGTRMASFDLWCAAHSMCTVMGRGYARDALARYGLDASGVARVLTALDTTRSSKFYRYRHRAEFLARGVVSRAAGGTVPSRRAALRAITR